MNRALNIALWLRMFRIKRTSSSYEPGLVSIPSIAIAVMWVMLWFLWPHGEKTPFIRKPVSFSPRVVFVNELNNTYSSLNSAEAAKMSAKLSTDDEDTVAVAPWKAGRMARILEKKAFAVDDLVRTKSSNAGIPSLFIGMEGYTPVWEDIPVFSGSKIGPMRLTIEPMGSLRDCGFQVPEFMPLIKRNDIPWLVTVYVEVGANGKVENVFLESGSVSKEINSVVVKSMYHGSLTNPGAKCEGRVKVNFGAD